MLLLLLLLKQLAVRVDTCVWGRVERDTEASSGVSLQQRLFEGEEKEEELLLLLQQSSRIRDIYICISSEGVLLLRSVAAAAEKSVRLVADQVEERVCFHCRSFL